MATGSTPAVPGAGAAPSAPAVPSTPSAPSAPSTPGAGAGGSASQPARSPVSPAQPAAAAVQPGPGAQPGGPAQAQGQPAAAAANAEPKATDFANTRDGQLEFLQKHKEWKAKQGEQAQAPAAGAQPQDGAAGPPKPGPSAEEQAAAAGPGGEAPATDAAKPGDAGAAAAAAAADVTPKGIADLMEKTPELKALFDAKPEVKGQIFTMARKLAAAEPVLELVPTRADAEFHTANSAEMIGLKTASMLAAEDPGQIPGLLDLWDKQFQYVDQDGKPVLGEDGQPAFAPDRKAFTDAIVNREMQGLRGRLQSEADALKQKLTSTAYPNEAARALDQRRAESLGDAVTALEFLDQIVSGEFFDGGAPELPADATDEVKAWFEQEKNRLAEERNKLEETRRGQSKEARKAAAAKFNNEVRGDRARIAGRMIGEQLKQALDSGVYIPEFYLQQMYRDPKTGQESATTTEIAARLFQEYERQLMAPGSRTLLTVTEHSLLPPNEQTRGVRREWEQARAAEMIPGLVQKEIARITKLVQADQAKLSGRAAERNAAAQPEPASGGSSLPQGASEQQLRTQAEETARRRGDWAAADPATKQAILVTEYNRLKRPRK